MTMFNKQNMKVSDLFNSSTEEYVCPHDMFGTCRRGDKCKHKHIEKTQVVNSLIYHIKDPCKLINRASIFEQLNSKFDSENKYFITTCTFKLQGHSCKNECEGRKDEITIKYKGKDLTIDFCYGNMNKKNNRIMIALHIDIEYNIKKNRLIEETIIPYSSFQIEEEIKEDLKDIYFPEIGEDINKPKKPSSKKKKEEPKWNIIETPKKEEEEIVIVESKKNEVIDLKLDMSSDITPIVRTPIYTMPKEDTYYRLSEPVIYSDKDKEYVLRKIASIFAC